MAAKQKRAADAAPSSARPAASKPDFVFTRVIDAPRELVWQAWTKPEHLAQWFGPQGFTVPESAMELRPGGAIRIVMRSPDGKDFVNTGVVREVAPPERLVFATALLGEGGAPVLEDLNTLTLETQGTKTKLTLIARVTKMAPEAAAAAAGMGDGWNETLDRLEQHVSMRELVITRVFDAPRELVWAAWTEPKHLTKWWGPKGVTTPIYEVDLRVGGAFRLCMILPPDGREHWVKGVYREVVPPKRLVVTGEMDDPKVTFTGAVTFEEHNGKTTLTLRTTHPGFMSADANVGWNGSFDKLAVYLEMVA